MQVEESGPATPHPSDIAVAGMSGLVTKVTVSLSSMNHTFPADVDVLLGAGGAEVHHPVWYGNVKATQELARDTFEAINRQQAFNC